MIRLNVGVRLLSLLQIYKICEEKDMVPEMVWTRSRMGDNKGALYLIIDRLGDVNRVGRHMDCWVVELNLAPRLLILPRRERTTTSGRIS